MGGYGTSSTQGQTQGEDDEEEHLPAAQAALLYL